MIVELIAVAFGVVVLACGVVEVLVSLARADVPVVYRADPCPTESTALDLVCVERPIARFAWEPASGPAVLYRARIRGHFGERYWDVDEPSAVVTSLQSGGYPFRLAVRAHREDMTEPGPWSPESDAHVIVVPEAADSTLFASGVALLLFFGATRP